MSSWYKGYLTHFLTQAQKLKKKFTLKKFLIFFQNFFCIFQEAELSNLKLKKLLYFYQKNFFLHFEKWKFLALRLNNFTRELSDSKIEKENTLKNFLYFGKWKFVAPSLKKSFKKKLSRISGGNLQSPRKDLYVRKKNFLTSNLKNFLCLSKKSFYI